MRHPTTGLDTFDRDWASSLYEGGKLYYAADCTHGDNKRLGLVCPLCSEAVFLAKGQILRPTWRHYRLTAKTKDCDRRVLTPEGRNILAKLQPRAASQRLKLFNRHFWQVFSYEKGIPKDLYRECQERIKYFNRGKPRSLDELVKHCRDRWDVAAILKSLPQQIKAATSPDQTFDQFLEHPAVKIHIKENPDLVLDAYLKLTESNFSVLRHKILSEVIEWLRTNTAKESFSKLFYLAFIDLMDVTQPPIHSNQIANMMIVSLVLTDWEAAIEANKDKQPPMGFSR